MLTQISQRSTSPNNHNETSRSAIGRSRSCRPGKPSFTLVNSTTVQPEQVFIPTSEKSPPNRCSPKIPLSLEYRSEPPNEKSKRTNYRSVCRVQLTSTQPEIQLRGFFLSSSSPPTPWSPENTDSSSISFHGVDSVVFDDSASGHWSSSRGTSNANSLGKQTRQKCNKTIYGDETTSGEAQFNSLSVSSGKPETVLGSIKAAFGRLIENMRTKSTTNNTQFASTNLDIPVANNFLAIPTQSKSEALRFSKTSSNSTREMSPISTSPESKMKSMKEAVLTIKSLDSVPMDRSPPTRELSCQPTHNENNGTTNFVGSVTHRTQSLNPLLTEEVERLALVVTAATAREAEIEAAERRRRQNSSIMHSNASTPSQATSPQTISHRIGSAVGARKCNTPLSNLSKSGVISPREDGLQNCNFPLVWCPCCMNKCYAHDQSVKISCQLRGNMVNNMRGFCHKTPTNFVNVVLSNQKQAGYSNTIAKSTATCLDLWCVSGQHNNDGNKSSGDENNRSAKMNSPPLNGIDNPHLLQQSEKNLTSAIQSATKFVHLSSGQHFCESSKHLTETASNCAAGSPCQQRSSIGVRPAICSTVEITSSRLCPIQFFRLPDACRSRSMPLLNEAASRNDDTNRSKPPNLHSPTDGGDLEKLADGEFRIPFGDIRLVECVRKGRRKSIYRGQWHGEVMLHVFDDLNAKESAQFWQDVTCLTRTRHENIALFLGACIEPPVFAIVTSVSKGVSLYQKLHIKHEKLWRSFPLYVLRRVVHAVDYLHSRMNPIFVRHLSSRNIFLEPKVVLSLTDYSNADCNYQYPGYVPIPSHSIYYIAPELLHDVAKFWNMESAHAVVGASYDQLDRLDRSLNKFSDQGTSCNQNDFPLKRRSYSFHGIHQANVKEVTMKDGSMLGTVSCTFRSVLLPDISRTRSVDTLLSGIDRSTRVSSELLAQNCSTVSIPRSFSRKSSLRNALSIAMGQLRSCKPDPPVRGLSRVGKPTANGPVRRRKRKNKHRGTFFIHQTMFDESTDIFALGTIIFELHAHTYPFQNLDTRTYVNQLCSGHRDEANSSCFQDSMRLLMFKCWSQAPSKRPTSRQIAQEIIEHQALYRRQRSDPTTSHWFPNDAGDY